MSSHTPPVVASSRSRALRRALLAAMLLAVPFAAHALYSGPTVSDGPHVYVWRDASGAVHFSQPQ
ncbi:MAG: hypothetical protein ABI629_25730 [bacterium]